MSVSTNAAQQTGQGARMSSQVLDTIKSYGQKLKNTFLQNAEAGSKRTAETARGFSREAVDITLSPEAVRRGAFYIKPQ